MRLKDKRIRKNHRPTTIIRVNTSATILYMHSFHFSPTFAPTLQNYSANAKHTGATTGTFSLRETTFSLRGRQLSSKSSTETPTPPTCLYYYCAVSSASLASREKELFSIRAFEQRSLYLSPNLRTAHGPYPRLPNK